MAPTLLFITGVLAGLIAGFVLIRTAFRPRSGDGHAERKLLEERLFKADQGLEQLAQELQAQRLESKTLQEDLISARENAVGTRTQLESVLRERDHFQTTLHGLQQQIEQIRLEREQLAKQNAETSEKLRSQESQTCFLEQARADLLTQFRSLSGQMLDSSRDSLLKTAKETVSEPVSRQFEQLRSQVEALQKDSAEKLSVLAQTTMDLRQRSEDVQGAAQQLTSALRSPNVKGQWGEVNLKRILEFVGLISYCDFDQQVHVGTEDGAYRPDCVITIPGSRRLIVDSKAPIESYLDALRCVVPAGCSADKRV